ncbi:MAG: hypothetical protein K9I99_15075 [Melioribacteraceae bacterium]|nr:hypothetical protein [Melioribacteraceae bacterium]MCF8414547.1 hypothetical protein [Melioribacteraceae bacterium]
MAKKIPIKAAREFARKHKFTKIIIIAEDDAKLQNVCTWGETVEDADYAAQAGNYLKTKVLQWPEKFIDEPNRVKKLRAKIDSLRNEIKKLKPSDGESK